MLLFSASPEKDRLIPRIPPNTNEIHRIPGAVRATICGVGSTAKLKTTTTSSEKTRSTTTVSLVLSSSKVSFQMIAAMGLIYLFI
jgi:hypothetical protein